MAQLELKPLAPKEAVEYFRQKGFRFTWRWWEMWQEDHHRAFTVAKVMRMDLLEDIREAVDRAIASGMPLSEFKRQLEPILRRKGWWGRLYDPERKQWYWAGTPWRLKTIFRVNTQVAYNVGRYRQMTDPDVLRERPFWMYDAVNDSRTRPAHAALDGTVLPATDPFWQTYFPPNGWNCRCRVRSLSERELRRRGLKPTTGREALGRASSMGFPPDKIAPPEWRYNPGETFWRPDLSKYAPGLRSRGQAALAATRPTSVKEAQGALELIRDAYRRAGIPATTAPVSIKRGLLVRRPGVVGQSDYPTGRIGLRRDVYSQLAASIKEGRITDETQTGFLTLVHEFGHLVGRPIDPVRYSYDRAYHYLSQVVNEVWTQGEAPEMAKRWGLRWEVKKPIVAYKVYVDRAKALLEEAGLAEEEIKTLFGRLNLFEDPAEYSPLIEGEIARRFGKPPPPDIQGEFGEALVKKEVYERFLAWIKGLRG